MKLLFNESQPPENSSDSDEDNDAGQENNFEIPDPQVRDESLECGNSVEIIDEISEEECIIISSDENDPGVIVISSDSNHDSDETYCEDIENIDSQENSESQSQSLLKYHSSM